MRVFDTLDDFVASAGSHLGFSEWTTVDQARIQAFADATGDHQWIHTDPARAMKGPFGGTIAHGYLTLALIPKLTASIFRIGGLQMGVNYGLDRVRFPSAMPSGARARAGAELIDVQHVATGVQALIRVTITAEAADRPTCVADTVTRFA